MLFSYEAENIIDRFSNLHKFTIKYHFDSSIYLFIYLFERAKSLKVNSKALFRSKSKWF